MVANTANTNKVSPDRVQGAVYNLTAALREMTNSIEAHVNVNVNGHTMNMMRSST